MQVMKYNFLLVLSVLLLAAGVIAFGFGFYTGDAFFIVIGVLLLVASTLAYLEAKKTKHDPFS